MLVEIDLLDYLAYQMGCGVLSDLRLSQQSERLHRLTAAIPLGACSEWEWLDAAQYLTCLLYTSGGTDSAGLPAQPWDV